MNLGPGDPYLLVKICCDQEVRWRIRLLLFIIDKFPSRKRKSCRNGNSGKQRYVSTYLDEVDQMIVLVLGCHLFEELQEGSPDSSINTPAFHVEACCFHAVPEVICSC